MFKVKNQFFHKNKYFLFILFFLIFVILKQRIYAYPLLEKRNTGLHTDLKEVSNAKANIVVTHGIAESSKEYERLSNFLNNNNYNVLLYDIRSHGQSRNNSNDIADINNFNIFIDDLHLIINSLKQKNNLKNILLGHSLGGMINNCYIYKYNDVEGVINSGGPTKIIESANVFIEEEVIKNMPKIPVGRGYNKLSRLPLTQEMKNFRSVKFLTPNFVRNTMVLSIQYFQENLINNSYIYPQPLLLLHGSADSVILSENSQEFFDILTESNKELRIYPNMYHNLFNDLGNEQVYQDVIEWLEQIV
ncbi:alpha/beta fold hydrolase [Italian clover phyllody phytoplasma]|uniref:alpha/beta fold hydrolase n=1 Tax=Italian clover phyllody phytoplasma TaxID=1196420 RepID=UPI000307B560|nr:alpha/beta fold hydrolase [Italian clover phyllody phytoplasma]